MTRFGYALAHPGQIGRDIARRLFDSESKTVLNQLNDALRTIDPNVLLRAALRECPNVGPVVVDGMRFQSNYDFLKDRGFQLWNVVSSPAILRARLEARAQVFDWEHDAKHPSEHEIEKNAFDVTLLNDFESEEFLFSQVDALLGHDKDF